MLLLIVTSKGLAALNVKNTEVILVFFSITYNKLLVSVENDHFESGDLD